MLTTFFNYYKVSALVQEIYQSYLSNKTVNEVLIIKLYDLVRNSGCVCIKFFQWILPLLEIDMKEIPPWFKILERIYDDCNTHDKDYTLRIFKRENGYDFNERYELLEIIASGSIGQVYRIKEIYTDKILAMKILHPNIRKDILYFRIFTTFLLWIPRFKDMMMKYIPVDLNGFIHEFNEQTNMIQESQNINVFLESFDDSLQIYKIPKPISYTRNTLIMTYHKSEKFEELECSEYLKTKIIRLLAIFMWNSFRNNICHEDIHKGNWGVNISEDNKPNLVIYDFGLCARLLGKMTKIYNLLENIFEDNGDTSNDIDDKVVDNVIELAMLCIKDIDYNILKRFIRGRWNNKDMLVCDSGTYMKLIFACARENKKLINTSVLKYTLVFSQIQKYIEKYYQVVQLPEQEVNQQDAYRISIPDNYSLCETENICKLYRKHCEEKMNTCNVDYNTLFHFTSENITMNQELLKSIKDSINEE
ncbi:MAG: hypothetical protein CMD32_00090 [Flavobacteriales bacterium]|nr:hypothetical protein [Flavobacteriales bacterium]